MHLYSAVGIRDNHISLSVGFLFLVDAVQTAPCLQVTEVITPVSQIIGP